MLPFATESQIKKAIAQQPKEESTDIPTPTIEDAGKAIVVDDAGKFALGEVGGGSDEIIIHKMTTEVSYSGSGTIQDILNTIGTEDYGTYFVVCINDNSGIFNKEIIKFTIASQGKKVYIAETDETINRYTSSSTSLATGYSSQVRKILVPDYSSLDRSKTYNLQSDGANLSWQQASGGTQLYKHTFTYDVYTFEIISATSTAYTGLSSWYSDKKVIKTKMIRNNDNIIAYDVYWVNETTQYTIKGLYVDGNANPAAISIPLDVYGSITDTVIAL